MFDEELKVANESETELSPAMEMVYSAIRPFMIYRKKAYLPLPKGEEKPGFGNALFFLTPNSDATISILQSNYIRWYINMYRQYTKDTIFREKIGRKRIIRNINAYTRKNWTKIQFPNTLKLVLPAQRQERLRQGKNIMVDLGDWCDLYFQFSFKTSIPIIVRNFMNFIGAKIGDNAYSQYQKKFVYIPIDLWFAPPHSELGYTKKLLTNPLSILLFASYKYPEIFAKFPNVTFILADSKNDEFMIVESSFFQKSNYTKIRNRLTMFTAINMKDDAETELEREFTPEEEDENSDLNNKENLTEYPDRKKIVPEPTPEMTQEEKKQLQIRKDNRARLINEMKRNLLGDPVDITEETDDEDDDDSEPVDLTENEEDTTPIDVGDDSLNDEIEDAVDDAIKELMKENPDILDSPEEIPTEYVQDEVERKVLRPKYMPDRSEADWERIKELQKSQDEVMKATRSLNEAASMIIDETDLSDAVRTRNKNITKSKYINFDKAYNTKKLEKDIDDSVAQLSKAGTKVFIASKTEEDTSDQMNLKRTLTYDLVDEFGDHHKLVFDVPIIVDNNYIYLNGTRSLLSHQQFFIPIVKTKPDTVQIITFYNKATLTRKGANDFRAEAVKKYLISHAADYSLVAGNAANKNMALQYSSTLDVDLYARQFMSFNIGRKRFFLDRDALHQFIIKQGLEDQCPDPKDNEHIPVGVDMNAHKVLIVTQDHTLTDLIYSLLPSDALTEINKTKGTKQRVLRTEIEIMSHYVPLALLLFFFEGFSKVMKKANIEYYVLDKNDDDGRKQYDPTQWGAIETADKWIIWKRYPIQNSLLMNGLSTEPFDLFNFDELDDHDTYIDLITPHYPGKTNIANNLMQFYDFMIDERSAEILRDYKYPTDFVELLLVANQMMTSNSCTPINNANIQCIRSNEIIAQFVYEAVANAYNKFRNTQGKQRKKPDRITVKRNCVLTAINKSSLTSPASSLNPILELEKVRTVTPRGPRGVGKDRAMTFDKRAYDPSMIGIVGMTTSNDAKVGVNRQLTLEPAITSTRGYVKVTDPKDYDKLNSANLLTPAEMLSPPGALHDDGPRTAMAYKQSQAMVPIDDNSPVLFGSKIESVVPYHMSRDFCVVAQDDGQVVEIKEGVIVVKYKNGRYDSINTNVRVKKNSAAGFYINVRMTSHLTKVGQKFKKNEVIGWDETAFTKNGDDLSASMNVGTLIKLAIMPSYDVYEDSAPITQNLSKKFGTTMTMEKSVGLAAQSYVEKIVNVGDTVHVGDPLIVFDEAHDDDDVTKYKEFLRERLGETLQETIAINAMSTIKSKYDGTIVDIKAYSTVLVDELSPTLQTIVKKYNAHADAVNELLDKYRNPDDYSYYKCGQLITETSDIVQADYAGRVKNKPIGSDGRGVLILFYISFKDYAKVGDKGTAYTALKFVTNHVIPEGKEAYSEFRPDEEISTYIAPSAVLARKTPSILLTMFANKCIIELKRKLKEQYYK